jgi:hypothetical protein
MFVFGLVWFGPGLILLKTWSTLGLERLVCESLVFHCMDCYGLRYKVHLIFFLFRSIHIHVLY